MCLSEYFARQSFKLNHGSKTSNCTNDQPRLPELTRAKSAVQTSEISPEPPFLLIKSIIGYININCKKAFTVLYTIYDMPINVEQHFIEYCIHIYRFHVLHEARHHELNEICDYKLILTYTVINVEQRN